MQKKVTPIKPSEIIENLEVIIPSFIFEAVNAILKEKFRGTSVTIKQNEIITKACQIKHGLKREDFFEKKWLDIEEVYEKYGWSVTYDKPAYNENYEACFEFKTKK
jgi:hypothetical protein